MADRERFKEALGPLIAEIMADFSQRGIPPPQKDQFGRCLTENIQGGKLNRGLTVLDTGHCLLQRPLTTTEFQDLSTLGWLTEMFQAAYLIWDDIMDKSEYRRGKPCWYRQDGVGLAAGQRCLVTEILNFRPSLEAFRSTSRDLKFIELFNEVGIRTELGQLCDTTTQLWDRAQDDYLDVYGDSSLTGRVGTDIRDNKCTWFVVETLCRRDVKQRRVLDLSYGRWDDVAKDKVKKVFQDLYMRMVFGKYKIEKTDNSNRLRKEVFELILGKIQHRDR
ncbi:isoprenoid synthase domain-containing protein [Aspergillus alliaceus]|uniref:Isoprenoid synthase domain-containing protein n=1 Tax=Petromyces alliaceus TaxID=209559 RepID=A0A5N7C2E7_PETAA|nr:isoprenoid synthase domain-containing protein [Aspergillus alliaceus]